MHSLEKMMGQFSEEPLIARVESLVEGCSKDELKNKGSKVLDEKIEEMNREDLLNLTMEIQHYLNDSTNVLIDESIYDTFAIVYGAACLRLEKMDEDTHE